MKTSFLKSAIFCIALFFSFSIFATAQTQQSKKHTVISETPKTVKAKREIIKLLLLDFFKNNSEKKIYISTQNIPTEIQTEFPQIKNLTAKLIQLNSATAENHCIFEFKTFSVTGKNASVSFGDCKNGLGYTFQKSRGKWKLVSNQFVKEI